MVNQSGFVVIVVVSQSVIIIGDLFIDGYVCFDDCYGYFIIIIITIDGSVWCVLL